MSYCPNANCMHNGNLRVANNYHSTVFFVNGRLLCTYKISCSLGYTMNYLSSFIYLEKLCSVVRSASTLVILFIIVYTFA